MRITAGICKGRILKTLPCIDTRPTKNQVKEAIFNIIGPYFPSGIALDLFAGSGSLGIEALSRGVQHSVFVEKNRLAVKIIETNLKACGLSNSATIINGESLAVINKWAENNERLKFSYVFMDPPYEEWDLIVKGMESLQKYCLLTDDVIVICEHSPAYNLPQSVEFLKSFRNKKYGSSSVTLYRF